MAKALELDSGTIETLIVYLRKWHALEADTGQNDGSNDTDDIHDDLEMNPGHTDKTDLENLYAGLNDSQKRDISALLLIGMEEASALDDARKRIEREEVLSLDDLLEMPLAPEYLSSAFAEVSVDGSNIIRLQPPEHRK